MFHINDKGNIKRCTAASGNCRFGSEIDHANSRDEARARAEEKLSAEYYPLGLGKSKRPIDHLTNLLFAKPAPMPRDMKAPMPEEFHIPRGQNGYWDPSDDAPESTPAAESTGKPAADHFAEFVKTVETANSQSQSDRVLSQAAWDFHRERVFNREIPVVDDQFKLYYNKAAIINSNLTLQGWEPENATQDYIVKELVSNILAQHDLRLEIDGVATNPFSKSFDSSNNVETVGKPNNAIPQLELVSDFSNGVISGLIDATERAKNYSFVREVTKEARKNQLRKFLKKEAALYEMEYQEDQSDFNDGRAWFMEEWLEEGF